MADKCDYVNCNNYAINNAQIDNGFVIYLPEYPRLCFKHLCQIINEYYSVNSDYFKVLNNG